MHRCFAAGDRQLRVSLFGVPLQTQKGPEIAVGEAMRYLAELAWAPQAIAANAELDWNEVDHHSVEVTRQKRPQFTTAHRARGPWL